MMRITTSWKEEGRLEGIAAGRQEGIAVGRQQILDRLRQTVKLLLTARFGEQATGLMDRLPQLEPPALEQLIDQLAAGADLDELS